MNSVTKKVSVIVPLYNGENYIEKCIESVLCQSYKNLELIIVNDGSTDNSGERVKAFSDSRIMYLCKENGGCSSARNVGLDHASGEYCVFVDADDELNTDTFLEELVAETEYDYVVGGLTHCYFNDGIEQSRIVTSIGKHDGTLLQNIPGEFFIKGFIHTCCGKMYKRSIIEENKLRFESVRLSEDSLFNAGYLKHIQSWKIMDSAGYSYIHRRNGYNATAKVFRSDVDVYVALYRKLSELPVKKIVIKRTMYAQFLAICLRTIKNPNAANEKKRSDLKYILKKPYVRTTLLTTVTTVGEWITGVIVCTGSLRMYSTWTRLLASRGNR